MKNYKEFEQKFIGASDIASLTCRSVNDVFSIDFGKDGTYYAYIVDGVAEIGEHYTLVKSCKHWLKIFDDCEKTIDIYRYGSTINIYRAGEQGCIIQIIKEN